MAQEATTMSPENLNFSKESTSAVDPDNIEKTRGFFYGSYYGHHTFDNYPTNKKQVQR